jgi:mannose/fructose-specific phosphotransferase system component IIA
VSAEPRSESPGADVAVPALVVMHGDLAAALLRAVTTVYGSAEGLEALSNAGLSREALQDEIERRVRAWGRPGLVCVDFWGSSCHVAAACVARRMDIVVITGCHLGMLLDFMHNRAGFGRDALAERLREKGLDSIRIVPPGGGA